MLNRSNSHRLHLAIEGIDGAGKSTALHNTKHILEESGVSVSTVHYTQKSGFIGKVITELYRPDIKNSLIKKVRDYRPLQATLYGTNGRLNLYRRQRGTDVLLTDRSILSGYASHNGRIPTWLITAIESTQAPDVIAYLDLPIEEASNRIYKREEGMAGYEESLDELRMFRDDYETLILNRPHRLRHTAIEKVDALQDPITIARSIARIALENI
jgi:thymidylate kinase